MSIQSKVFLVELIAVAILMAIIWYAEVLITISSLAAILVILGINLFILRRILKRLHDLHIVISAVSKGNVDKRAKVESQDEISQLAKDLNIMIESLMEARRLPENILRSMKDGLFVVDIKGNIREANQAMIDMLGYAKEELIGKSISAVFTKRTNL